MAGRTITIDLGAQLADGHTFNIDAEARAMLLEGLEVIDLTLKHQSMIAEWQARDRLARPWVYLEIPA
jgi:3-isopropylmalate/(R)-2-methylmalate dehydratase small subunit